jgi:deoxyribonuclease (pyrimidine dimer)
MTRINCIPPSELRREHLVAEYRELPRIRHAYPRSSPPNVPPTYRLGPGHLTFFYDKGVWLERRHRQLIAEMRRRGYQVNLPPLDLSHWPSSAMNDWQSSPAALAINRERIQERLAD